MSALIYWDEKGKRERRRQEIREGGGKKGRGGREGETKEKRLERR